MASIADSLKTSSINITNISKSLFETKRSVSSVNDSVANISRIISTNTRIKRDVFANTQLIESRRREALKRKEIEDQLESSKVSSSPARGLAFAGRSDKGPLGRLLGFLGFITAGWIVENLPTWIFMGQEFVTRIQIFGRSMYNMIGNMQLIIDSFGSVLKNSFNAIITLDFSAFSEGSVAQSFDELNLAVQGLGDEITETFRLFTTPLNESVETGEKAPALDEERPDTMFPPSGEIPGVPKGAGKKYAYVYELARKYGDPFPEVTAAQAIQESGHVLGQGETGKYNIFGQTARKGRRMGTPNDPGGGSKTFANYSSYDEAVKDHIRIWVPQYGNAKTPYEALMNIQKHGGQGRYAQGFPTKEFPGGDWMGYVRATSRIIKEQGSDPQRRRTATSQQQKPTVTPQTLLATSFTPVTGTSGESMGNKPLSVPYSPFKPGSGATITSGKGMRWGKQHRGYDIAAATGTPLYAYFPGKVTHIGIDGTASSAGYGNWVVWQDDMYGAYHFFGHMRDRPSVRVGQVINQGTLVGYVGSTGESTGPHLHWEISNNPPQSNGQFTSYEDPGSWLRKHPLKSGKPGAITSQPNTPPAQISFPSSRMGQPAAMTPQRKGSQIVFIDATQPQAPQVSYPSQQPTVTPTISEFKLLNNFIKNKLLLDLAYL